MNFKSFNHSSTDIHDTKSKQQFSIKGKLSYRRRQYPLSVLGFVKQKNKSGALSNRKDGLFHIRYFENGPLEPG